uniref:Syndecan/Neurexin domain-containing protein n=1 Tax=Graphocephala atropunctata TaxID=36148 RepID=A0A1B6KP32_9HEMI
MCASNIVSILLLCVILSPSSAVDGENKLAHGHVLESLHVFPNQSTPSTPILKGDNPTQSNTAPMVFPTKSSALHTSGPPILSGTAKDIAEMKNSHELVSNASHNTEGPAQSTGKFTEEQEDMLHSKYTGGHDVDEKQNPKKKQSEKEEKKASEKDEKKPIPSKKDPKSEVEVDPNFDKEGPKMMNETKTKPGDSVLGSTSKMMAMSSSVLSTTQVKHHGLIEPMKTAGTVLLSVLVVLCLGLVGLLIWKRIAMRRFGRDILINEDDFDEVSDMHTFEGAQIQIT